MRQIRENYKEVINIAQKNSLSHNINVFKLFFTLFSQFMQKEIKLADQNIVENLFKDGAFLKSLFCFALQIESLINKKTSVTTEKLVKICKTSYYNLWIILFYFAKMKGRTLPIIIRSRIIELEIEILLKLIWKKNKENKTEAEFIFS